MRHLFRLRRHYGSLHQANEAVRPLHLPTQKTTINKLEKYMHKKTQVIYTDQSIGLLSEADVHFISRCSFISSSFSGLETQLSLSLVLRGRRGWLSSYGFECLSESRMKRIEQLSPKG